MPLPDDHLARLAERARLGLPLLSPAEPTPRPPPGAPRDADPSPSHTPHVARGWTPAQLREWDRLRKRAERAQKASARDPTRGPPVHFWWLLVERGRPRGVFPARTRAEAYRRARVATGRREVGRGLWPGASLRLVRPAQAVGDVR